MELHNSFSVPSPPADVFGLLLDMERIAPCMPGAKLLRSEGGEYHGEVRLKVGPISAAYEGVLTIDEADTSARRAHLTARGREVGGQGSAQAGVVATVEPDGSGSKVVVVTDLEIAGKAAQFGRGVLADVAERIIAQFARNLEATLQDPGAGTSSEPLSATAAPPAALDLRTLVGPVVAQRGLPVLVALLLGVILGRWLGNGSRPTAGRHAAPGYWLAPSEAPVGWTWVSGAPRE